MATEADREKVAALKRRLNRASVFGEFNPKRIGILAGHMDKVCHSTEKRRDFVQYMFNVRSMNDMAEYQLWRLHRWLSPLPVPEAGKGVYTYRAGCEDMVRLALAVKAEDDRARQIAAGQMTLDGALQQGGNDDR